VNDKPEDQGDGLEPRGSIDRRVRVDAQRNTDALLEAALAVFTTSGVDAPVREIAEKAGVGIGTMYRHFPLRSALIAAVFRREIDACADAAPILADEYTPFEALAHWMQRYAAFIATKRGLAKALHSGDPAFDALPAYFDTSCLCRSRRRGSHRCRCGRSFARGRELVPIGFRGWGQPSAAHGRSAH